ncbi:hypothetical protein PV05_00771 [Exophiala xenobiotica]|uniref:Ornithine cyclodeaminase n=1 Tax=Exophiala xenobiotica TaxID=348802 RepID=A0A0D2FKA6_9EURO|nr:uncharacterized protein PV05_00771 [Exophiala xenobiotica]KIW60564.1 hypothetical protein PV05_00771 [Exophiala xenobiotica]
MKPIYLTYLNGPDIVALEMTNDEILQAVEDALDAQGRGKTVIEPRVHLVPRDSAEGHFNVLRGVVNPLNAAGVKIVGDFVNNYKLGFPSEFAILNLFDPRTGVPLAIIDATTITDMRTGAMTAIGAKYLARKSSKILGHIGARGSSYWNIRLMDSIFHFDEIRLHSKRQESRQALGDRLSKELGKKVTVLDNWEDTIRGADIVVEASRLSEPEPLLKTEWIKKGALVMPYGTMSSVELSLTDVMSKVLVDDWGHERITEESLYGEMGQVVCGQKPGRENDDETILFWHRGLSLSDIALGMAMLDKAKKSNIGQSLRFE